MINITQPEAGKIEIKLDNGHAQALQKVMADYGIQTLDKTLGFILTVMRDADGQPIQIGGESFVPSEKITGATVVPEHGN